MSSRIAKAMWEAMAESPNVMVALNKANGRSEPMHAQLDKDADGHFWFYTTQSNRIAAGGKATVQFVSKNHKLFACITGELEEETNPAVIDKYWSNAVEAWYENGRQDASLKMMRFNLDDAEIWSVDPTFKGLFKLMSGVSLDPEEMGDHAQVQL